MNALVRQKSGGVAEWLNALVLFPIYPREKRLAINRESRVERWGGRVVECAFTRKQSGGVAEWSIAPVLKTGTSETGS